MAYLDSYFNDFYDEICIHEEADALRDKRDRLKEDIEKYLPEELEDCEIEINKSDLEFINQGSYAIHTTIQNDYAAIDLDYAVIIPINTNEHRDPRQVKKATKNALSHVASRTVNIKEPCVTVSYFKDGQEDTHIDFPIYASDNGSLFLARGKENSTEGNYEWEPADPKGLNEYFSDFLSENDSLRKTVRLIKKWKQELYKDCTSSNKVFPSVGLTILVCQNYYDDDHSIISIYETLNNIKKLFEIKRDYDGEIINVDLSCDLPVTPKKDILYKMRVSKDPLIWFYKKLEKTVSNLKTAIDLEDEHEAGLYLQKIFGDGFEIPKKETGKVKTKFARESSFG